MSFRSFNCGKLIALVHLTPKTTKSVLEISKTLKCFVLTQYVGVGAASRVEQLSEDELRHGLKRSTFYTCFISIRIKCILMDTKEKRDIITHTYKVI